MSDGCLAMKTRAWYAASAFNTPELGARPRWLNPQRGLMVPKHFQAEAHAVKP